MEGHFHKESHNKEERLIAKIGDLKCQFLWYLINIKEFGVIVPLMFI